MKISLNCKLDSAGAYSFIKPIADIEQITQIDVFRDKAALECKKVNYHSSFQNKKWFFGADKQIIQNAENNKT